MSNRFLTANGTPASGSLALVGRGIDRLGLGAGALGGDGGEGVERRIARGDARERASTTAAALTSPAATACAIFAGALQDVSPAIASGLEDRRRLGGVRQRKFADQRGVLEGDREIGLHRRLPVRFQRQAERGRGSREKSSSGSEAAMAEFPLQRARTESAFPTRPHIIVLSARCSRDAILRPIYTGRAGMRHCPPLLAARRLRAQHFRFASSRPHPKAARTPGGRRATAFCPATPCTSQKR